MSRLATISTWAENGAGAMPLSGGLGPHLTQFGRGQGVPACQVSSLSIQPFGHNTFFTSTSHRDRTDKGPIAVGKRFRGDRLYKKLTGGEIANVNFLYGDIFNH